MGKRNYEIRATSSTHRISTCTSTPCRISRPLGGNTQRYQNAPCVGEFGHIAKTEICAALLVENKNDRARLHVGMSVGKFTYDRDHTHVFQKPPTEIPADPSYRKSPNPPHQMDNKHIDHATQLSSRQSERYQMAEKTKTEHTRGKVQRKRNIFIKNRKQNSSRQPLCASKSTNRCK